MNYAPVLVCVNSRVIQGKAKRKRRPRTATALIINNETKQTECIRTTVKSETDISTILSTLYHTLVKYSYFERQALLLYTDSNVSEVATAMSFIHSLFYFVGKYDYACYYANEAEKCQRKHEESEDGLMPFHYTGVGAPKPNEFFGNPWAGDESIFPEYKDEECHLDMDEYVFHNLIGSSDFIIHSVGQLCREELSSWMALARNLPADLYPVFQRGTNNRARNVLRDSLFPEESRYGLSRAHLVPTDLKELFKENKEIRDFTTSLCSLKLHPRISTFDSILVEDFIPKLPGYFYTGKHATDVAPKFFAPHFDEIPNTTSGWEGYVPRFWTRETIDGRIIRNPARHDLMDEVYLPYDSPLFEPLMDLLFKHPFEPHSEEIWELEMYKARKKEWYRTRDPKEKDSPEYNTEEDQYERFGEFLAKATFADLRNANLESLDLGGAFQYARTFVSKRRAENEEDKLLNVDLVTVDRVVQKEERDINGDVVKEKIVVKLQKPNSPEDKTTTAPSLVTKVYKTPFNAKGKRRTQTRIKDPSADV